jgi:hypothetical protein
VRTGRVGTGIARQARGSVRPACSAERDRLSPHSCERSFIFLARRAASVIVCGWMRYDPLSGPRLTTSTTIDVSLGRCAEVRAGTRVGQNVTFLRYGSG